jgi:hypothetical protein
MIASSAGSRQHGAIRFCLPGVVMNPRILSSLCLLAVLTACDQSGSPDAPRGQASETPVALPVELPPPAPEPAPEPEPVVISKKPQPALSKKPEPEKRVTESQPPFEFDLRLPQELLDAVAPGETLELEPLLPAFFGRPTESNIRLNGRLIESPDEERLFDGAEVRIEIRN